MARFNPAHTSRRNCNKSWYVARRGTSMDGEEIISLVDGPFHRRPREQDPKDIVLCIQAPPGYHIQRRGWDTGAMLKRPSRAQRKAHMQKIGSKSRFRREDS